MTKYIDMVVDLQFGSTGKGLLAGWLAKRGMHDTVMTAWAPNAGHTYIDSDGRKFVHTMLANGIVGTHVKQILIGPGSILNLDNLWDEIKQCQDIIEKQKISIFIHPHAARVTNAHRDAEEQSMTAIGSTKKGVGEAAIQKIRRDPKAMNLAMDYEAQGHFVYDFEFVHLVKSPQQWLEIFDSANIILIEGAQGFGLSIHHGFYPYVTSRDVTPSQILADCGVPFEASREVCVWGTARTYPIRVANRFNKEGEQVGWSGPCYSDQVELDWEFLGMIPELTTVTKLPRRIFTFSAEQMRFAKGMCSPNVIFLNFVNYLKTYEGFQRIYEECAEGNTEVIVGFGPTVDHVINGLPRDPKQAWAIIQNSMNGGGM